MAIQTWSGREVHKTLDTLEHIGDHIPTFQRRDFVISNPKDNFAPMVSSENAYLDVIVKDNEVPVATVSKNYALVAHREVTDALKVAFSDLGCDPSQVECDLSLTEYGERMWLELTAPDLLSFDPGDGHPLELRFHAINSVDGSLRLSLTAGWHRLICANGMMRLSHERKVQRRHTKGLDSDRLTTYLEESLDDMEAEPKVYQRWHEALPEVFVIQQWIRTTMRATWGNALAARAYHIFQTGEDGTVNPIDIKDKRLKETPDKMRVVSTEQVPGQPSMARSKYDMLNAITFLASHQDSFTARHKMMMQVPGIIEKLNS